MIYYLLFIIYYLAVSTGGQTAILFVAVGTGGQTAVLFVAVGTGGQTAILFVAVGTGSQTAMTTGRDNKQGVEAELCPDRVEEGLGLKNYRQVTCLLTRPGLVPRRSFTIIRSFAWTPRSA